MSAWGVIDKPHVVRMTEIMSEELVKQHLQEENVEEDHHHQHAEDSILEEQQSWEGEEGIVDEETWNEVMLSQEEIDRDFAMALALQEEEEHFSHCSNIPEYQNKVIVGGGKDSSPNVNKHIRSSDRLEAERLFTEMSSTGNAGEYRKGLKCLPDGTTISKHDTLIDGLINSVVLSEYEGVGDLDDAGILIGNKVANELKSFRQKQRVKGVSSHGRLSAKEMQSTMEGVLDPSTRMNVFKLIQADYFDKIYGVIKTGKEANVYHGYKDSRTEDNNDINRELIIHNFAVKIFKTTLSEFKNRHEYFDDDHRFAARKLSKGNLRTAITRWTEKEYRNLARAHAEGLPVPQPIIFKDNCIVMSLISDEYSQEDKERCEDQYVEAPSPQLKELRGERSLEEWEDMYSQTIAIIFKLYVRCKLVHGDLSEYNLLWNQGNTVFAIDFGQAVDISHPRHMEYLRRDIATINSFFGSHGVNVANVDDVIRYITSTFSTPKLVDNDFNSHPCYLRINELVNM